MHALRSARRLASFVLALFVLVVGVAAAAPVVQPQRLEMVCSGGSVKLMQLGGDDADHQLSKAGMDCPLCATAAPPPSAIVLPVVQPLGRALQPIPSAQVAAFPAAALPPRGPPSFA